MHFVSFADILMFWWCSGPGVTADAPIKSGGKDGSPEDDADYGER